MGGVAKTVTRGLTAGLTGGLSEWTHGKDAFGLEHATNALGITHSSLSNAPAMAGGNENPAQTLAHSGGAPLLANIALGANVDDSIAGYFGAGDFKSFYGSLNPDDQALVDGVRKQLTSIQSDTKLKNQAVQQIVNDFPNIAAQAAQARQASGEEFDSTTKAYLDKALGSSAAKYAANGSLSSGAMAEASARVGADMGMQKLNYMDSSETNSFNQGVQGWQARYNEANALRNFQNLMTQGAAGQGFSAVQASLNRNQQSNIANAGFQNQQNMMNQQSDNAMFGAIGGLAGTGLGMMLGGPMGGALGGQMGRMANSGAATGGMQGASDYGFSGVTSPGYAMNNNPRLYGIGG